MSLSSDYTFMVWFAPLLRYNLSLTMNPKPPTLDELARLQIAKWLRSTDTTQTSLANAIGRNQPWMTRYLAGEFDADLETLQKMARYFGHNLSTLLELPPDPEEALIISAFRALREESRAIALLMLQDWSRARAHAGQRSR